MDLRFCSACGQSVLDDEATICPFCGKAMDGSGGGRSARPAPGKPASAPGFPRRKDTAAAEGIPPAGRAGSRQSADAPSSRPGSSGSSAASGNSQTGRPGTPPNQKSAGESRPIQAGISAKKSSADEDDPFDLGAGIQQKDVIQALKKPEKGRLLRVVCPMCEQAGFVSKAAIGRQARCANEKCMVPIFTVQDPTQPAEPDRLARARSSAAPSADAQAQSRSRQKNPLIIYGIAGALLLVLVIGLSAYLNRTPEVPSDLTKPIYTGTSGNNAPEEVPEVKEAPPEQVVATPESEAARLVKRMIATARHAANRDKGMARRMTSDIMLRLNDRQLAAQELSQLLTVSRQSAYYEIVPLVMEYFRHPEADHKEFLERIRKDAAGIPGSGRTALESVMAMATIYLVSGDTDAAKKLIESHQRDLSVSQNRDAVSCAAWYFASACRLEAGLPPLPMLDVITFNDPLRAGVTINLCCQNRWTEALAWSQESGDPSVTGDLLMVIASHAIERKAEPEVIARIEQAADPVHEMLALRVRARVAGGMKDSERLKKVEELTLALPERPPVSLKNFSAVLDGNFPDRTSPLLTVTALTEVAIAAHLNNRPELCSDAVRRMLNAILSLAPSTAETRTAQNKIERQPDAVRKPLAAERQLTTETDIDNAFRSYRRKLDRYSKMAEDGRLLLISMLCRIVRFGGADSVRTVFDDEASQLKEELLVDGASRLIMVEARIAGQNLDALFAKSEEFAVPMAVRAVDTPEVEVLPLIAEAWLQAINGTPLNSISEIKKTNELPGLCECALQEILQFVAAKAKKPDAVYQVIWKVSNAVWREDLLISAGRTLAARNLAVEAEKWLNEQSRTMPPSEQVSALYGIASGLLINSDGK
jgi:hypothetical protein